jgi:hypothetical protein
VGLELLEQPTQVVAVAVVGPAALAMPLVALAALAS